MLIIVKRYLEVPFLVVLFYDICMYSHLFCVVVSMNEMKQVLGIYRKVIMTRDGRRPSQLTIYSLISHSRLCNLQVHSSTIGYAST